MWRITYVYYNEIIDFMTILYSIGLDGTMATMYRRGRAWQSVDITVKLMTGKTLSFSQIPLNTSIKELKLKVEDACGIPSQCQRLTYLDMCDMFDHKTLEQSDVVDRGRFNMKVRESLISNANNHFCDQCYEIDGPL